MAKLPETGETAPDFTLPADDGGTVSLRELLGRHRAVAVFFYPKDDTSGCTKEALAFSELQPQFAEAGCAVVGVSADSIASHRRFKAKHDLSITLASDPDHETLERYGVWGVVAARLSPVLSTDAVSIVAGLVGMRFWRFVLATAAGTLPLTVLVAWLGADIDRLKTGLIWVSVVSLATFVGYVAYDRWKARREPAVQG